MADNIALLFTKANPTSQQEDEKALKFIEEITINADSVQQNVLVGILNKNKDVEYMKRFGLNGATDRETFKSKIPDISYEDIHSDIKRIANGDRSAILSAHPISGFLTSSGTSGGERKLMPITEEELKYRHSFNSLIDPIMNQYVPDLHKGKSLCFMIIKSETRTPGGLLAQPALTQYYKSDYFRSISYSYTSPIESILCLDSFQSMYVQILCGLLERHNVVRIGTIFASGLVRAISFLQSNWQELASDIMLGTLNMNITDSSVRNCIIKILKPNPELADFLRLECPKENWEGIIRRIWPNAKYLETIVTGSMAQYIPTLNYYSGCLPLVSNLYGSSECYFALNLNPMCKPSEISYTIMPNMAYFEFIPLEPSSSEPTSDSPSKLVELVDVQIGKDYEVVITNRAGLYRYRVGDILRVTGFHNSAPQFQFLRRKGALLSIDSDKTDEAELQKAVENASQLLQKFNTDVIEYTSHADTKKIPGHYVIFWELFNKDLANMPSDEIFSQCCLAIEESFSSVYRQGRVEAKSIGPLEIRVVKNGTFEELMNHAVSKGSSISQYKVPRCVKSENILKILESRVLSSHFSPTLPHWTSERRFI